MSCASSGSPLAKVTTMASGSLPSSRKINCLRADLTWVRASMEFDRGCNADGLEFGIRLRSVVNQHLAGLLLRTTGKGLFSAAGVDLRGIGHQELHRLSL